MPIRLLAKIAPVAGLLLGGQAIAIEEGDLETIVVTGSRLEQTEPSSPTVIVPAEMIRQTGATTVERILDELPQFVPTATATSNSPSNDGQANVSLRGLGPQRTLVLLDGRRLTPADGRGAVDLNVLPPALIERIDVVTGGAAAVYGSDAIAGVVNVRLRDEFDGVELDGGWAETTRGDGEEYSMGFTAGTPFAGGRGSAMAYVGYADRSQVPQSHRAFSRYPLEYFPGETHGSGPGQAFVTSGSGIVEEGLAIVFSSPATYQSLFESYGYAPGTVPYTAGIAVNPDRTVFAIGDGTPGSVANFRGEKDSSLFNDRIYSAYNFAPDTALQTPLDRTSLYTRVDFEFSEQVEAYLQVLAADYTATRQLAPVDAGIALVPATNPHIPADLHTLLASRANPDTPFRYFKRLSELGPRQADNDRDMGQLTAGVGGALTESWRYDTYVQVGRNHRTEHQTNNVRLSTLQELTFAPDGGASICGDFDPFAKHSLAPACATYLAVDVDNHVTLQQTIVEVSVHGPVWTFPAGAVQAVFGAFYNADEFRYDADPILGTILPAVPGVIGARPDLGGFGFEAAPDRDGDETNTDVYAEFLVPVLGGSSTPSMDLGLGYRYSDYEHAGGVSSYKLESSIRPDELVRLRGSYQRTVRAPSIDELFYPPVPNQFDIYPPDPCSASSVQRTGPSQAAVEALCLTQGMPAAQLPSFEYPLRKVDGVEGGNPELEPETADTYTLGLVLTPTFQGFGIDDAQASIDWYRIDIEDGIGRWRVDSAVDRCFDAAFNPTFSNANVYCTFFERRRDTGEIRALILDRNIGGLRTSGVDLQLGWRMGAGPGVLGFSELLTYVEEWQYRDPSGGTIDYVGTIGGGGLGRSLPRWKSLLNLDYRWNNLTLFAKWQHIASQKDVEFQDFRVASRDYFGISASQTLDRGVYAGLTLRAGVENLFDEAPPIFPSWQQANTDPSQYDVMGRRYYLSVTYRV